MKQKTLYTLSKTLAVTSAVNLALAVGANAQTPDAALNALVKKGILSEQEAKTAWAEAQTNTLVQAQSKLSESKWKISPGIKSIQLFGDVRFRYENREAANAAGSGATGEDFRRDRFRYALRLGIRGEVLDNFYYGVRVETSTNPRSTWVSFGDDTSPTPFAKNSDGIGIGQAYVGWKPTSWYEMTVGKMPMPLYVTPMIWDTDLSPEGAAEKFKYSLGNVDLFANFGQFLYQDTNPDSDSVSSDTFLLAWQVGAQVKLPEGMSFKMAPVIYNYTGVGKSGGLNTAFSGQGRAGLNPNSAGFNQNGINDLLVLETPFEFKVKFGPHYTGRLFGDFGYNFNGEDRARAAFAATTAAFRPDKVYTDENKAYQVGLGFGNAEEVGKKGNWEARVFWQHIEQYAADVNLLDSDIFEGRGNLEGICAALNYGFTDHIFATARYGYANRINENLGTGGNNSDLPGLNPIKNYHILQLDLTYKF